MFALARLKWVHELSQEDAAEAASLNDMLGRLIDHTLGEPALDGNLSFPWRGFPSRYLDTFRRSVLDVIADGAVSVDAPVLARAMISLETSAAAEDHNADFARRLASSNSINAVVEIAHDMRSPLTSILFLVEALRQGRSGSVSPVQERQLGLIYGAALGLNNLACDVIDAVRVGHRLVDGTAVPFSIHEVAMGVFDTVRPISEEKELPIEFSLRAVDGRLGYPAALGRILLNLTSNALKYTRQGSVSIGCDDVTDSRVLFWVKDTGEGIPHDVMAMLFESFRPSTSGFRFSNAGLGLAICQSFLTSLGSQLCVETDPDAGTQFSFEIELPRA